MILLKLAILIALLATILMIGEMKIKRGWTFTVRGGDCSVREAIKSVRFGYDFPFILLINIFLVGIILIINN